MRSEETTPDQSAPIHDREALSDTPRVLITGAGGFLGAEIARQGLARGQEYAASRVVIIPILRRSASRWCAVISVTPR